MRQNRQRSLAWECSSSSFVECSQLVRGISFYSSLVGPLMCKGATFLENISRSRTALVTSSAVHAALRAWSWRGPTGFCSFSLKVPQNAKMHQTGTHFRAGSLINLDCIRRSDALLLRSTRLLNSIASSTWKQALTFLLGLQLIFLFHAPLASFTGKLLFLFYQIPDQWQTNWMHE